MPGRVPHKKGDDSRYTGTEGGNIENGAGVR